MLRLVNRFSNGRQNKQIQSDQHKEKLDYGFTKKYKVHQLVYYEVHLDVREAILGEKKIKRWCRQWKINLIEQNNPHWANLAIGLF